MERLIYSKFSNERNAKYAIETSVVLDEENHRWVLKRPMDKEGYAHIENIKNAYIGLCHMFADTKLQIQPYVEAEDGMKFPYVPGEDMEKILNRTYHTEGYEKMLQMIREYFEFVRKYSSTCDYVETEQFVNMFGNYEFASGTKCGDVSNLDYGFANVIISEKAKTLIDYEWTVDFPVPVDFLLYRCIHYYVYTSPNSVDMLEKGIFKALGFDESDIKKYVEMESHFQKYISSGKATLGELHETMGQATDNVHELFAHYHRMENRGMQVYYDYGEGFLHENSFFLKPEVDENGVEMLHITNIPQEAVRVRIDPRKEASILLLNEFVNENKISVINNMETNATIIKGQLYVFAVPDPWLVVKHNGGGELTLKINMKSDVCLSILQKEAVALTNEVKQLEKRANESEHLYQEVVGSTSWKITEPLRKIRNCRHS